MKIFSTKLMLILTILAIAGVFMSSSSSAGTNVDDVIRMENPTYKHKKAIMEFTHKKHNEEYKISCGECHHDKDNKPLDLKLGDDVQGCIECHKKPGKAKAKKGEKLTKEQKREHHADAIHDSCIGCHKKFNMKKTGKKTNGPTPTKCKECHPKPAK